LLYDTDISLIIFDNQFISSTFQELNFYSNYKAMSEKQQKPVDPPQSFFELGEVIKIIAPSIVILMRKVI